MNGEGDVGKLRSMDGDREGGEEGGSEVAREAGSSTNKAPRQLARLQ